MLKVKSIIPITAALAISSAAMFSCTGADNNKSNQNIPKTEFVENKSQTLQNDTFEKDKSKTEKDNKFPDWAIFLIGSGCGIGWIALMNYLNKKIFKNSKDIGIEEDIHAKMGRD